MTDRLAEIEARLDEDDPTRPHTPGRVGCRLADEWNLKQTRDLRDLLDVAKAALAVTQQWEAEHVLTTGIGAQAMDDLVATLANLEGGAS